MCYCFQADPCESTINLDLFDSGYIPLSPSLLALLEHTEQLSQSTDFASSQSTDQTTSRLTPETTDLSSTMTALNTFHEQESETEDNIDRTMNEAATGAATTTRRPYPPEAMIGMISDHDRPYSEYGHLRKSDFQLDYVVDPCDLDAESIARQSEFDLQGTETAKKRRLQKSRMQTRMFAITCRTRISSRKRTWKMSIETKCPFACYLIETNIMDVIHREFPKKDIRYVCVATDEAYPKGMIRAVNIQIILSKLINKIGWFLDEATGVYCQQIV